MQRRTHHLLVLALTSYALVVRALPGIGSYDFGSAWDEGYYAIVARGAASRLINWVYPFVFEGSLDRVLINKPPAFFWLGALALKLPVGPELALRLVSVLAGAASVPLFEAICRMYVRRRDALLVTLPLAASPLHVAFSRVYQMDVLVLFYALGATYLLLAGVRHKRLALIYAASPLLGLALLTKLWAGAAPVVAVLPLLLFEAKRRRAPGLRKHIVTAMVGGFVLFATWPVALTVWPGGYRGFLWMRNGSTIWGLLFSRYGTSRYFDDAPRVAEQLFVSYLPLGHFRTHVGAIAVEASLALLGLCATVARFARTPAARGVIGFRALPLFLWLLAFLPVQFGRDHYLQYLVVLVPVWSILIGSGLKFLFRAPQKTLGPVACFSCAGILLMAPVRMILNGDEILYRTHYREMGAFLRSRPDAATTTVACRYMPALSYYTGRLEKPYPAHRLLSDNVVSGLYRFVELKWSNRDNGVAWTERRWVRGHCTNVSAAAGVPRESLHALYDCGAVQRGR